MRDILNQTFTLTTFEQMLQWVKPEVCRNLVVVLEGFQMDLSKVIGKYMADSGLRNIWVESGV